MRDKKDKEKTPITDDPVKNFEKWKRKYNKTKKRVKQVEKTTKKSDWEVERENIQKLVNKYSEVRYHEADITKHFWLLVQYLFLGIATCLHTCYAAVVTSGLTDQSSDI